MHEKEYFFVLPRDRPHVIVAPLSAQTAPIDQPLKAEVTAPELQKALQSLSAAAMAMVVISSIEALVSVVILVSWFWCRRQVTKIPLHESRPKEAKI